MRTTGTAALLVAALACTGCSTLQVSTDARPGTTFSAYKTFAIKDVEELKDSMLLPRLNKAVTSALVAKGLTPQAENPDLWVVMHPRVSQETHVTSAQTGYGPGYAGYGRGPAYGYGYGYGTAWGGPSTTMTTIQEVPVGTLIVDLVDVKANQMVWRGIAKDSIDQTATSEKREKNINQAVQWLFKDYPPKK